MIPLNFKPNKKILDKYYNLIIKNRRPSSIKKLNDWCEKYLVIYFGNTKKKYSFEDVVKASPEELVLIARRVRMLKKHQIEVEPYRKNAKGKKSFYVVTALYCDMSSETRQNLLDALDIVTCPYCNRNYINSAKSRSGCHLDHFYDKMAYPVLAVSFYNLIPVCSTCNIVKANKSLSYSPHNSKYKADDLFQFSFTYKPSPGGVKILLKPKANAQFYKKNIETLELETLYQIHSDIVNEITQKAGYAKQYQNAMYNSLKMKFSHEEIMRHFLGNYYTENMYGRRPLAKLTHDIAKEVNIL